MMAPICFGRVDPPSFDDVATIFAERCTLCHSGSSAPLGLRLDSPEGVLQGSERGPVVIPGDPDSSELVRRIRGTSLPRMPLTGPPYLDDADIDRIVAWIAAGALPATGENGGAEPLPGSVEPPPPPPEAGSFEDVAPVFLQRCATCHSPNGVMGAPPEDLILTTHGAILAGGERVVVVPGVPLASELYRRVAGIATPRMPFDGPPFLDDATIERIRVWIARGAPGADGRPTAVRPGSEVRLHGTLTGRWELDGLPLQVTPNTRFDDDPAIGSYVEVRGVLSADGGVQATRIRAR